MAMVAEGNRHDDMQAHVKSYSLFSALMKWGAIISLVITFVVILAIAN